MHDVAGDQLRTGTSICSLWPSEARRVTVAVLRTIALSFSAARVERIFLGEASSTLIADHHRNDDRPGQVAAIGKQLHAGQHQQTTMNGFLNARSNCRDQCGGFSCDTSLGRRDAAAASI